MGCAVGLATLVGCSDGADREVARAASALHVVAPPAGAADAGVSKTLGGWEDGELLPGEEGDHHVVYAYLPDARHPDGWRGDDRTLVVRYYTMEAASAVAACDTFRQWVADSGAVEVPDCDGIAASLDRGTGSRSDIFPTVAVDLVGGPQAELGAQLAEGAGVDVIFWAMASV